MPISGNIFVCHNRKLGATDIWWAEACRAQDSTPERRSSSSKMSVMRVVDRGHTEDWFKRRSVAG